MLIAPKGVSRLTVVLEVQNLEKSFGGVPVLKDVSFTLNAGEVVALAGENGAGKSTIFKIVTGQVRPDAGAVIIGGKSHERLDTREARVSGIGIVPQELSPFPDLTVYENLFVGRELRNPLGILRRSAMVAQAKEMLDVFGVDIDPKLTMNRLSTALTQIVEIVKATTWRAQLILLDEPTSSMPEQEVERLYQVIGQLKDRGVAMMYTTHRMQEIQDLADRVLVMRDGVLVMDELVSKANSESVIKAMIGRDLDNLFPALPKPTKETGLEVTDLVLKEDGPSVSFRVRKGEILGLGGLVGAGRTEILEAIYGIRKIHSGSIDIGDIPLKPGSPRRAIDAGFAIVPEDRKGAGLNLMRSVLENGSMPRLAKYLRLGFLRLLKRRQHIGDAMESVALKSRSLDQTVATLSGGNQQKIVLARWLGEETKVLLLDEPTRGVDVGARGEIYTIIRDLAASGVSVLLVSSDTPELIGLSHRVLVVRGGAITGELLRGDLDKPDAQEQIFLLASDQSVLEVGHRG
jgi:ribose transport system ATP-binding protein